MDKLNGEFKYDTESGWVAIQYVEGLKHGVTRFFDKSSGLVLSEITYFNDVIDGEVKQYYPNGAILSIITYKTGIQNGPFISYYENGMKQLESYYVNGKQDGVVITYDEFGDKITESPYHNGVKHGKNIVYYPKIYGGGIFELSYYESGNLRGDKVTFYDTGEVMTITPYICGKAQQYTKNYAKNGEELRSP
ncbi:MAG: hypothetical protein LBI20_00980 [Holosporales bacterium]|jgi:antitoxin component YwqK of YwqJK toxin-antitoxin module|nr:hypothetical protein [Holosporales bacterium]